MARLFLALVLVSAPLLAASDTLDASTVYVISGGVAQPGYIARIEAVASIEICGEPPAVVQVADGDSSHDLEIVASNPRGECALVAYSGQFEYVFDEDTTLTLTALAGQQPTTELFLMVPILGPPPIGGLPLEEIPSLVRCGRSRSGPVPRCCSRALSRYVLTLRDGGRVKE